MKLTRGQIIAILSVVLTLFIAFLTNIVTSSLPSWVQSYSWLAWLLLFVSLMALLVTTIKGVKANDPISQIDDELLNHFIQVVSDAEAKMQIDPGLDHIPYIAGKLVEWQDIDTRLLRILGIQEDTKDWQPRKENEQLARLVLRLTKAIMPAIVQRGQWKELTRLAIPAYTIAEGFKAWDDAAHIAYHLALSFYDARDIQQAKEWLARMDTNLSHINAHDISDGLRSRFLDLKGVLARDYDGNLTLARQHFTNALVFARRTDNTLMIWSITTHLGTLEKKVRNFGEAIKLYEEALSGASQLDDPGLKLECYQALGDLALQQKNPDLATAHNWYTRQLDLATTSSYKIQQAYAHKSLAETLLLKNLQQDAKQAYFHAREALRIEQEITGPNKEELLILLVHIADTLLLQK